MSNVKQTLKSFCLLSYFTYSSKRVCMHGIESPYSAHIFMPSLFFKNTDMCRRKLQHLYSRPLIQSYIRPLDFMQGFKC